MNREFQVKTPIATLLLAAGNADEIGRAAVALDIRKRICVLSKKTYGADSLEYAGHLCDLATAFEKSEQWLEAEARYLQAMSIYRKHLPNDNPTVALQARNLAEVCYQQGRVAEAKCWLAEAARILKALPATG